MKNQFIDKRKAIRILIESASYYHQHLENRNIMFIYGDNQYIETVFLPRNFLHLTGIIFRKSNGTDNKQASNFYNMCLGKKISINDIDFKDDGTTIQKLSVLPNTLNIKKNIKMLGQYNSIKPTLITEKLAGNIFACIGFTMQGNYFIPNTVLKCDTRDVIQKPFKLLAIISKGIKEKQYSKIEFIHKDINANILLSTIDSEIHKINGELFRKPEYPLL